MSKNLAKGSEHTKRISINDKKIIEDTPTLLKKKKKNVTMSHLRNMLRNTQVDWKRNEVPMPIINAIMLMAKIKQTC